TGVPDVPPRPRSRRRRALEEPDPPPQAWSREEALALEDPLVEPAHLRAQPRARESRERGAPGPLAEPRSPCGVRDERSDRRGQLLDAVRSHSDRVVPVGEKFRGPSGPGDDHRPAARHPFHDRPTEGLRLRAGVSHDIEIAIDAGDVPLESYESDA